MNSLPVVITFYSLALLTLVPALCVVRARNIVHAGFWLLPCLVGVAGLFAILEAHFFFVVQLLVYAGAILVLILFVVMLTRDVMNMSVPQSNRMGVVAGIGCALLGVAVAFILTSHAWNVTTEPAADAAAQTRALGDALVGLYVVPFEVASILLLAGLIGAVMLAKSDRGPAPESAPLGDLFPEAEQPVEVE